MPHRVRDTVDSYTLRLAGGGLSSRIFPRQSASVACGPVTKVPLTLVLYQPDSTPRRSDSSVLTWRGDRFCMGCFLLCEISVAGNIIFVQFSSESRAKSASTAVTRSR